MTSFGNSDAASSSSGISAWSGGRSAIAARAPASSVGGKESGICSVAPTSGGKNSRYALGSLGTSRSKCAMNASTAGCLRATAKAGGSTTVSDASGAPGAEQRDDGAVRVGNEMVAGLEEIAKLASLVLEVDRLERPIRRVPAPSRDHEREPDGERLLRVPAHRAGSYAPVDENKTRPPADHLDVHRVILRRRTKSAQVGLSSDFSLLQSLICSPRMEPASRPSFQPAGAGALLAGTTAAGLGIGALLGWAAGSWPLGALGGALVGIPAGVAAVYYRYRDVFR
jgi:hypothetical protein